MTYMGFQFQSPSWGALDFQPDRIPKKKKKSFLPGKISKPYLKIKWATQMAICPQWDHRCSKNKKLYNENANACDEINDNNNDKNDHHGVTQQTQHGLLQKKRCRPPKDYFWHRSNRTTWKKKMCMYLCHIFVLLRWWNANGLCNMAMQTKWQA